MSVRKPWILFTLFLSLFIFIPNVTHANTYSKLSSILDDFMLGSKLTQEAEAKYINLYQDVVKLNGKEMFHITLQDKEFKDTYTTVYTYKGNIVKVSVKMRIQGAEAEDLNNLYYGMLPAVSERYGSPQSESNAKFFAGDKGGTMKQATFSESGKYKYFLGGYQDPINKGGTFYGGKRGLLFEAVKDGF